MSKKRTNSKSNHTLLPFIIVLLLGLGIGLAIFLSQTQQEIRSHAAVGNNVSALGTKLLLNGGEYKFTGVNAYDLASDYSIVNGCGDNNSQTDIDNFFSTLRPNSMVRFWAYQSFARNKTTGALDFTVLDRIVASAEKYNIKLIPVLTDQWAFCYQTRKTEAWYGGGYKTDAVNGNLAYWDYLDQIIPRYANKAVIGMWEPVNEPAADDGSNNCSLTAPATLKSFFDSVGGKIHSLDPNHLVSSGLQGSGQCGSRNGEYQTLHSSIGIDVGSYHDYMAGAIPGDQWNGLQVRLNQMAAVNKPLYIGEVGIKARDNVTGCTTTATRRDLMKQKMDAQFPAGIVGFVPWNWVKPNTKTDCTSDYGFEIEQGQDVLLTLLHDYILPEGGTVTPTAVVITPTSTPTPTPTSIPPTPTTAQLDTILPSVIIVAPSNGTTVPRGSNVTITANATDNVGVTRVEFYINNVLKTPADTTYPYTYSWNVPSKPNVTYTLKAIAYDSRNASAPSTVTVTAK